MQAEVTGHDPYAAFRFKAFRFYATGNLASIIGQQMLGVASGLQLWRLTHSETALGLVGLVQAFPILVFSLLAGHTADKFNRKHIVLLTQIIIAVCSFGLAALTYFELSVPNSEILSSTNAFLQRTAQFFHEKESHFTSPIIPLFYFFLLLTGIARAFNDPARHSMLPQIVPLEAFSNMVTWNSSNFQIGSVAGPALAGFMIALFGESAPSFAFVYLIDGICALILFGFVSRIPFTAIRKSITETGWRAFSAGLHFVFSKKIILATITLDLFAVLFGGATALLPVFADKTLHVGAVGLGWLRSAPAIGAFVMALIMAHRPPLQKAGKALLWAVAGFGAATLVFGLSKSFWLSMFMLFLTGAFDNVSVVVRHTLVQLLTPNEMRGRVSAVNNIFIGSSNELGAFESGLTAAWFGHVPSVVVGGIGSIMVVVVVAVIWPEARKFGALVSANALSKNPKPK